MIMKLIGKLNEFNSAQNKNINNNVTSNQNLKFQNLDVINTMYLTATPEIDSRKLQMIDYNSTSHNRVRLLRSTFESANIKQIDV